MMADEATYNTLESPHHPARQHNGSTSNDNSDYSMVEPQYQRLDPNGTMPKNTYSSLTSSVKLSNGVPQDYLTPVKMLDGKMVAVGDDRYSVISKGTIADRPAEKEIDSSSNKNNSRNNNLLWILLFVTCVSLIVAVIAMVLAGIALAKTSESTTPAPVPNRGPSSEVIATTTAPQTNTAVPSTVPIEDLFSRIDQLNETLSMLNNNITTQISHQITQSVNEAELTNNKSLTRVYDELQPLLVAVGGDVKRMSKKLEYLQEVINQMSQTIDVQNGTITTLEDRLQQLEDRSTTSNGTTNTEYKVPSISQVYTQWGRLNCSKQGVSQVYTGYTAGPGSQRQSFNNNGRRKVEIAIYGGGTNMLCLTSSPSPHDSSDNVPSTASTLYAALYLNDSTRTGQPHPIPCSVCEVHDASTLLTIPGTNKCPQGWDKEYSGFIMAQSSKVGFINNVEESEYICVDNAFETYPGAEPLQSNGEDTVTYMSKVKVDCEQGIPCSSSQYSQSLSITCAVCSKST